MDEAHSVLATAKIAEAGSPLSLRWLDVLVFVMMVAALALGVWLAAMVATASEPCAREELRWPPIVFGRR